MDPLAIQKSTSELIAQFPQLEGFVDGVQTRLTDSVKEVVTEAVEALANGIGMIVQLGESLNGATIDFELEPIVIPEITIPRIKAKFTVNIPLIPKGN